MRGPHPSRRPRRWALPLAALATALAAGLGAGCVWVESATPQATAGRAERSFEINVDRVMRGTVASETVVLGFEPVLVRGYGLVVGLDGTGSRDIPPALKAHMVSEMTRRGVGQTTAGFGHVKPDQMLASPDTAVVIVEGVISPGAVGRESKRGMQVAGTSFDIRVYADPRTGTTSLDGGRLYTAELRPVVEGEILPPVGSHQAAAVAEARGPIFVNPFAEPGAEGRDTVNRTIGRILDGGEVTRDMPLKLRLATPSHVRAEVIQSAINTRFPREPGQSEDTARGESSESILITVPLSFRDRPDDFVQLLRHTTIRQANAEAVANSIKRILLNDAGAAYDASWRWQALGERSLPTVSTLYDYPEVKPRLAALRAGAKLGDARVIPHVIDMARDAPFESRRQAVNLLTTLPLDPRIDQVLRELVNDDDVDVRLAAYEAAVKRADPWITRHVVDDKFVLDVVESQKPLIYITQIGQPRVALFGTDVALAPVTLVDAWSGRLLLKSSPDDEYVEVYYRPLRGGDRILERTDPRLEDFIQFLGHTTSVEHPEPGLGLSYSETVGALYQISRQDSLDVAFRFEQDRVQAAIMRLQEGKTIEERPEFSDPDFDFLRPVPAGDGSADGGASGVSDLDRLAPPPLLGSPVDG
jgi:flagellar basal body P-ring protein FlgI